MQGIILIIATNVPNNWMPQGRKGKQQHQQPTCCDPPRHLSCVSIVYHSSTTLSVKSIHRASFLCVIIITCSPCTTPQPLTNP